MGYKATVFAIDITVMAINSIEYYYITFITKI